VAFVMGFVWMVWNRLRAAYAAAIATVCKRRNPGKPRLPRQCRLLRAALPIVVLL